MSVKMRAKLTIQSIERYQYSEKVNFSAIYGDSKEDNTYTDATPCASANLTITNKDLIGKFNPGDQFYVDFIPINK